jgi:hypothetical protein
VQSVHDQHGGALLLVVQATGESVVEPFVDPLPVGFGQSPINEPLVFDEAQTYTGDPTPLTASRTYQWIHSLPQILGALTATGLVLDFVHEHPWLPWPPFPMCIPNGNGAYCLAKGGTSLTAGRIIARRKESPRANVAVPAVPRDYRRRQIAIQPPSTL